MSDQYRIKYNTDFSEKQLKDTIEKVHKEIRNIRFKARPMIVNSIFKNIKEFIVGFGMPSFKNRNANQIPSSKEFNQNVSEIYNDIKNAYSEINYLNSYSKEQLPN